MCESGAVGEVARFDGVGEASAQKTSKSPTGAPGGVMLTHPGKTMEDGKKP